MTTRELWLNIMHYKEFDRMPVIHWGGWGETRKCWIEEGIPEDIPEHEYFNASPLQYPVNVDVYLHPKFKEETIEETDEYIILRQQDGVIAQHWKNKSSIPHYIDFTLKDAGEWDDYKRRLQPDPIRVPVDLEEKITKAKAAECPIVIDTGSMIGWIRDWMGVENLAYLCYDNRDLLSEMVDTISNLVCWGLDQVLPKVKVDCGWGWEDICFRSGPLISPAVFKKCVVPGYRKISNKLLQYGVELYVVDCDGLIDDLLPLWLEGGVNVMFPIEIGSWECEPRAFRQKYGRELRLFGGIDKIEIAKGPKAIDAEIARRIPLMKDGGFIPLPDHLIPPDVSLDNYKYYLERIRNLRF